MTNEWDYGITRRKTSHRIGRNLEKFRYISDALQHCERSHNKCSTLNRTFSPTRLLDIAPADKHGVVQLISGVEICHPIRYIALSHCWGPPEKKPTTTTTQNEKEHRESGIPMESLPVSFIDAIKVAHALDIRYIWIDSLCIIQNNANDWANESHQMADIYKFATLTLAASQALDSSRGFLDYEMLLEDDFHSQRPQSDFYFETPGIRGQYFKLYCPGFYAGRTLWLRREANVESSLESFVPGHTSQPLACRAWPLQERILSRRTVFFDSAMLQWECKTANHLERWTVDVRHIFPSLRFDFAKPAYPQWYTVVEEFPSRSLTYEKDALPAMSGLAREFARATNDTYLAGLWRNDIFRGLSWGLPREPRYHQQDLDYGPLSLVECFAPTWSWASLKSGAPILHSPSFFGRTSLWENASCFLPGSPPQKLISAKIIPLFSGPMGQILSAKLVIQGSWRNLTVNLHRRGSNNSHPYGHLPHNLVWNWKDFYRNISTNLLTLFLIISVMSRG